MPKHATHEYKRSEKHIEQRKYTQEHSCIHLTKLKQHKIIETETLTLDVFRLNEGSR